MDKYYILKRNNPDMLNDYFLDILPEKRGKVSTQIHGGEQLVLIEKTIMQDNDGGTSEHYTNMWTFNEGCPEWEKHTKGRVMYDYTGVVYPLIHIGKQIMTFEQYINQK